MNIEPGRGKSGMQADVNGLLEIIETIRRYRDNPEGLERFGRGVKEHMVADGWDRERVERDWERMLNLALGRDQGPGK